MADDPKTTRHADDCEFWHDQYPWECTCHIGATPFPGKSVPRPIIIPVGGADAVVFMPTVTKP